MQIKILKAKLHRAAVTGARVAVYRSASSASAASASNVAGSGGTSAADEIARLAELQKQGHITPEEFQQAKAKLLS